MIELCPNCSKEFVEQRDGCFRCSDCGWLRKIDGKWHSCPEPVKPADVSPPAEPKLKEVVPAPPGPVPAEPDEHSLNGQVGDRPSNVRSYLGGLVTVTETEDDEDGT